MPARDYAQLIPGPTGILFVAERVPNQPERRCTSGT
jgi:hypothetical protein